MESILFSQSRSKNEDPEQLKLKQKAKEVWLKFSVVFYVVLCLFLVLLLV